MPEEFILMINVLLAIVQHADCQLFANDLFGVSIDSGRIGRGEVIRGINRILQ